MSKFKFIITCKDESPKLIRADFAGLEDRVKVVTYLNNAEPLAKVYNKELAELRAAKDADFIAFVHGDVHFDVQHFVQHIEECAEKYDVFGLCGTEVANVSQSPLNWYTSSNPTPGKRWGCVTHGELGNTTSFFSSDRESVTDHEVALIDGLCIVFGKKALESEMTFDETFMFDQYDTDCSLQALMKYGLKIGVIVEQSLQHYSVGRSIQTIQFLIHEIDLRKKWKLGLPAESPIRKVPKELILRSWQNDHHPFIKFSNVEELIN